MSTASARPTDDNESHAATQPSEGSRMSFGDHLEELRNCLILALLGIAVTTGASLYFGKAILGFICRPLFYAQYQNGLAPNIQVLAPTAAFTAYFKIAFLSGLILGMPWVLYQLWRFVASGLYEHERRFVKRLLPASIGLFVVGVVFLYYVVLPLALDFLIRFNRGFDVPALAPTAMQPLLKKDAPSTPGAADVGLKVPVVEADPKDPAPGSIWFNSVTRRLVVQGEGSVWSSRMDQGGLGAAMESQFAIDFYISFVLLLALAFGVAFETPVVVFFLAWSGLVATATMAGARRYVLLASFVLGAVLTPGPDVLSQVLLSVPMYLLFELGIAVARLIERRGAAPS